MSKDKSPTTTQEILLSELLGDVGKLHDAIKQLPDLLSAQTGALTKATKAHESTLGSYVEKQKSILAQVTLEEKLHFREEIKTSLKNEAGDALKKASLSLDAVAQAINQKLNNKDKYFYLCIIATVILSLGCGFLGGMAANQYQDAQKVEQLTYGSAVISIWHQLDHKTKLKIQDARKNAT